MTPENRGENAAAELARARVCLEEANALQNAGMPYGAVSRAYYAVFHAARALLYSAGLEARTHRGLIALVNDHFVKPGHLSPEIGRLLSHTQRDREDADYVTASVFTLEEARATIAGAERVMTEVRRLVDSPPRP